MSVVVTKFLFRLFSLYFIQTPPFDMTSLTTVSCFVSSQMSNKCQGVTCPTAHATLCK